MLDFIEESLISAFIFIIVVIILCYYYFKIKNDDKYNKKRNWSDIDKKNDEKKTENSTTINYDGSKNVTLKELKQHDGDSENPWICVQDKVYDITQFVDKHPGGRTVLIFAAGSE
jgi:cytochrome b involved in lipid metabolism